MANETEIQKEAEATPAAYDLTTIYDVRLAKIVKVGAATIRPLGEHQMSGEVLNGIVKEHGVDAILSARPR